MAAFVLLFVLAFGAAPASAHDVAIKVDPMEDLDVGYTETFTIRPSVAGAEDANGPTTVDIALPVTLQFVSATGEDWVCKGTTTVRCVTDWEYGAFEEMSEITVKAIPKAEAYPSVVVSFSASAPGDPNTLNNSATVTYPVGFLEDVSLSVAHLGTWNIGSTETVRMIVTNVGEWDTEGLVKVTNQLSPGLSVASIEGGSTWTCAVDAANLVTCASYEVRAKGKAYPTINIKVTVTAGAAPTATSTAAVAYGPDPNRANDSATVATPIPYTNDLAVAPASVPATQAGVPADISFKVDQLGKGSTSAPTGVSFAVPAGVAVAAVKGGSGWSCVPGPPASCTIAAGRRAFPPLTLTVVASRAALPGFGVTATVGTDGDQNGANNQTIANVGLAPMCIVPALRGLSTKNATAALATAGCTKGRVKSKRLKSGRKRSKWKKVVSSQKVQAGRVLPDQAAINVSMKWVRKR